MSSTGITLIEPISLPSGAGQDYAGGDVRHVSETVDELSGRSISATTRQLAERDNLLAAAVNQLIAAVNNKDQVDNVALPSVTIPPGETVTVSSLRIPAGFEMRVLNAIVSSSPASVVRLDILYNQGVYGLLTGSETIVSTLAEFTDGTSFLASGELIIRYVNTSGRTANAVASLTVTQRPVGAQKGGIIGPGAKGERGDRGPQGFAGPAGSAGLPGAAGPAGITYRGTWSGTTSYAQRDTVHYDGSSYYAIAANTGQVPPDPDLVPSAYWDLLAREGFGPQGAQGVTGAQGPQGATGDPGLVFEGTWAGTNDYQSGDVVFYDGSSFVSIQAGSNHTPPDPDAAPNAYWDVLARRGTAGAQGTPGAQTPLEFVISSGTEHVLELSDAYKMVRMTSALNNAVVVPLFASEPFDPGTQILLMQENTGTTTVEGDVGVDVFSRGDAFTMAGRYGVAKLINLSADAWVLSGDVIP